MLLDLCAELRAALTHPETRQAFKALVIEALAQRDADAWLSAREAARYVYGCDDRDDAFRRLRARHPELDRLSSGTNKLRRWKRADLDRFIASNPRIERRRSKA
jgi:hypothetical protein